METWLEIDLEKLAKNYQYIKNKTQSPICSVIKADGYGMGIYDIAMELDKQGTSMFAVAFINEGEKLRKKNIKKDILIFNFVPPSKLAKAIDQNLTISLYGLEQLKLYIHKCKDEVSKIPFHIKLNTGMSRLGFNQEELDTAIKLIAKHNINITGVYSHFAQAEDNDFTDLQYNNFLVLSKKIEELLNKKLVKHIANSTAALCYNKYYLDMVRIGMLLYGLQPLAVKDSNIKGIFTWKSKISCIRNIKKGERISYGDFVSEKDRRLAIIPVGYSHGYMRQLSNKACVVIANKKCPLIGTICMDQMIADITEVDGLKVEDEVILLGEKVEAEILANLSGTIADDIICKINPNIKRILKRNDH